MRKDLLLWQKCFPTVVGIFYTSDLGINMNSSKRRERTKMLVMLSLFTAIAYLSIYIVNFKVQFLTFDIKNVFITVAAMVYGPVSGVVISLAAAFLELIFYSTTGFYGFVMNFLSSASFALVASLLYRRQKTLLGSYFALFMATISSTAVMLLFNVWITPFYMGVSVKEVAALIPMLLLPFNAIKCVVNAALVMVLYKPISLVMMRSGMIKKEGKGRYFIKNTLLTVFLALFLLAVSLVIFFIVLGGQVDFGA